MFFLWILSFLNVNTYDVLWKHDVIEIPLYEEVTPYTLLPEVEVFSNGIKLEDIDIFYQRGVDRTFLSVLHSLEVKTFYIKYRVYIPSIGYDDIKTITFKIIDQVPPEIMVEDTLSFFVGSKVDLKPFIKVKDNYYQESDLELFIDYLTLDTSRVGLYHVFIKVKDPSLNEFSKVITVIIYDNIAPEVTLLKPIVINPHQDLDIKNFIKIKDNIDTFFNIEVLDALVAYELIGIYPITILVYDQSLNLTRLHTEIEIKDTLAPELILVSSAPILDVYQDITTTLLESFIVYSQDAYDENPILTILYDIDITTLGSYKIYYTLTDFSQNETSKTLQVYVKDQLAPTVKVLDTLQMDVYKTPKPLLTYFIIEDNYDDYESIYIVIKENIDFNLLGQYPIEVTVTDSSKNKKTFRFYVDIIDREPPKLLHIPVMVTQFMRPDYKTILQVSDQYDTYEDIKIEVFDSHIDYLVMGSHQVKIILKDLSFNVSEYVVDIMILDLIKPNIVLKTLDVILSIPIKSFDPLSYIDTIEDNQDIITFDQVVITYDISFEVGVYQVQYEVYDQNGLYDMKILDVIIVDGISPTVVADMLTFKIGDEMDLYQDITVTDHSAYEITLLNTLDFSLKGIQRLYYVVYDQYGNETFFSRDVHIVYDNRIEALKPYLASLFVAILGVLSSFLMWRKYHKSAFDNSIDFKYNIDTKDE